MPYAGIHLPKPNVHTAALTGFSCPPPSPRAGQEKCQECGPGTIPDETHATCELCPEGTASKLPGVAACPWCPAGTFRVADGGDGTECSPW